MNKNEKEMRGVVLPIGWVLIFCLVGGSWLDPSINGGGVAVLLFTTVTAFIWKGVELIKGYNKSHWFDVVEQNMEIYNLESVTDQDVMDFMCYHERFDLKKQREQDKDNLLRAFEKIVDDLLNGKIKPEKVSDCTIEVKKGNTYYKIWSYINDFYPYALNNKKVGLSKSDLPKFNKEYQEKVERFKKSDLYMELNETPN